MFQNSCRVCFLRLSVYQTKTFPKPISQRWLHQKNNKSQLGQNLQGLCSVSSTPNGKEVKEVQIPVPWGHISGKWWGSTDIQPLLGLHGWQDNAGTWDRLAPLLPPHISLLAVDFPGHGLSSHFHPGRAYHFLEYIFFVRRIMEHYGWEKVSFLSHSMGSITSFVFSCVYPALVDKYIGIDAMKPFSHNPIKGIRDGGKSIDKFIETSELDPKVAPTYTYKDACERLTVASKGSLTPETTKYLLVRGLEKLPDGKYRYTRDSRLKIPQLMNWTHETILELASNLTCSVCNIKADPGLEYDKPERHEDVYNVVKKSAKIFENHKVEGTHHLHLNTPEAVLPIILKFLEK